VDDIFKREMGTHREEADQARESGVRTDGHPLVSIIDVGNISLTYGFILCMDMKHFVTKNQMNEIWNFWMEICYCNFVRVSSQLCDAKPSECF
jgi:hypothetical protein